MNLQHLWIKLQNIKSACGCWFGDEHTGGFRMFENGCPTFCCQATKQRLGKLCNFHLSSYTVHNAICASHLTHSVLKFLSKTWRRFRREFSNFIRRCSTIFTSADIHENQSWIVTSGIRSTAEIFCEYPKAEFISEKRLSFEAVFPFHKTYTRHYI